MRFVRLLPVAAMAVVSALATAAGATDVTGIRFLGAADIPTGTRLEGTRVGGLSGLARRASGEFLAVSDDKTAPRAYGIRIDLSDGRLEAGDVSATGVIHFRQFDGGHFLPDTFDPEGVGIGPNGRIFVADEGYGTVERPPIVRVFDESLRQSDQFDPPEKALPNGTLSIAGSRTFGARTNLGFESIAITPDGTTLMTATEQALIQDGPGAGVARVSRARMVAFDLGSGLPGAEYVYEVEPIPTMLSMRQLRQTSGLVELLALDDSGTFLALERSFTLTAGFQGKLFLVKTADATDVRAYRALPEQVRPAEKTELLDLSGLGIPSDNVEGMAFGDWLDEDTRTLILVSDNNFRGAQTTRFLAFALDVELRWVAALPLDPDN